MDRMRKSTKRISKGLTMKTIAEPLGVAQESPTHKKMEMVQQQQQNIPCKYKLYS